MQGLNKALAPIVFIKEESNLSKYVYPAVFTPESEGYSINFPDIPSCYTQGDNLEDGIQMAQDVLALTMYDYEINGKEIPKPSDIQSIQVTGDEFVSLVICDTVEYKKMHSNRAVKKTLTIPEWLNEEAIKADVNFSQVLQEALQEKINKG